MDIKETILAALIVINLISFLIIGYDKAISANRNARRIPEKTLFTLALLFGASGIYLGMLTFRHKTRKWYFQIGTPLLIAVNLVTLYIAQQFLRTV
jgi:uncharacterized membrane protein YsdA (DUF1294 family)